MSDVAEGVLVQVHQAIIRQIDAPGHHILPVVIARGEAEHLDHAGGRRVVAISRRVGNTNSHELAGAKITGDVLAQASMPAHSRNCSVMAAPIWLFSVMNSPMYSCSPGWKMPSIRLFCSRARMPRAWRWAGACRP